MAYEVEKTKCDACAVHIHEHLKHDNMKRVDGGVLCLECYNIAQSFKVYMQAPKIAEAKAGLFSGIEKTKPVTGYNFITQTGGYRCRIRYLRMVNTKSSGEALHAALEVIVSTNSANGAGAHVDLLFMQKNTYGITRARALLGAALRLPAWDITNAVLEEVSDPSNPLEGLEVDIFAEQIKSKTGSGFTQLDFYPVFQGVNKEEHPGTGWLIKDSAKRWASYGYGPHMVLFDTEPFKSWALAQKEKYQVKDSWGTLISKTTQVGTPAPKPAPQKQPPTIQKGRKLLF